MTIKPKTAYAKSKLRCEKLFYNFEYENISFRIPGLFGLPRMNGLVYNILKRIKSSQLPKFPTKPIFWNGMYIDDAVGSLFRLIESDWGDLRFIDIGYKEQCSVNKLIEIINSLFNKNLIKTVKHPLIEFNYDIAQELKILPAGNLKKSINKLFKQI